MYVLYTFACSVVAAVQSLALYTKHVHVCAHALTDDGDESNEDDEEPSDEVDENESEDPAASQPAIPEPVPDAVVHRKHEHA